MFFTIGHDFFTAAFFVAVQVCDATLFNSITNAGKQKIKNTFLSTPKTNKTFSAGMKKLYGANPFTIRQKGTKAKALFALGLVSFFWGTTWLASKTGVKHMPALQLAGIRQTLGGLIYVVYFISKGKAFPRGKQWGPILILCALNFIISNGLATWGVKFISSGLASIIGAMFPLWLVIIALIGGKESISKKALLGFLLGFGGICIIFYEHLHDFLNADFIFGIVLSIIASLSWAFAQSYTKKHAVEFNPYFSIGLQMIIAGISLYTIAAVTGNTISIAAIPISAWLSIAYLVIIGSAFAFVAYLYALQHLPTAQVSIYAYINPIVAVILGSLVFGEKLTIFIVIGGLVTLTGVYLVNSAFRKSQ